MAALTAEDAARLAPWFDTLPSFVVLPERRPLQDESATNPGQVFWLKSADWDSQVSRTDPNRLKALELLALLARVDWQLWQRTIRTIWPRTASVWAAMRPMEVGIELCFLRPQTQHVMFQEWVSSANPATWSTDFVSVRKTMLARLQARGCSEAPIAVQLTRCLPTYEHDTPEIIMKVLQLLTMCPTHRFEVKKLTLMSEWFTLEARSLRHLLNLTRSGVRATQLLFVDPEVFAQSPELFVQSMLSFYGFHDVGDASSHLGASKVMLRLVQQRELLPALFVALRQSRSVRAVKIAQAFCHRCSLPSRELQRLNWLWMAYALFCRDAGEPQRLDAITIDVNGLRSHHVAAMANALTATDPLGLLLDGTFPRTPCETTSITAGRLSAQRTLSASQFALREPSSDQPAEADFVVATPLQCMRVLECKGDWTSVLLPGWSHAWVHKDHILASDVLVTTAPVVKSAPYVRLTRMSNAAANATLELLKLVGRSTRAITLFAHQSVPFLNNLRIFLDGYASGACRLERLDVTCSIQDAETSLVGLLEALSDTGHPASRYLREFSYNASLHQTTAGQPIFAAVVRMLEQNKTLLRLKLRFTMTQIAWELWRHHVTLICHFDGSQVPPFSSPQQRKRHLAFLSVIGAHHARRGSSAVDKVDARVASLIVGFLATTQIRRVVVEINRHELNPQQQEWRPVAGSAWQYTRF